MSRISLVLVILLLGGCSIPSEFVRTDGSLIIEMAGRDTFRIGNYRYTTGTLEIAMQVLRGSNAFKSVEMYIPADMASERGFSCQAIAAAIEESRRHWTFYAWTPGHPETLAPVECEYAVLA